MARLLVRSKDEVLANFQTLIDLRQSADPSRVEKYRSYLKSAKVLVVAQVNEKREYAPSRFVGYRANTLVKHTKGHQAGENDGTVTNAQLVELFGKIYYSDPEEDQKFEHFCEKYAIKKDLAGLTTPLKYIFADFGPSPSAILRRAKEATTASDEVSDEPADISSALSCYLVGTSWEGHKPKDQLPRFLKDNIWINGHESKFTSLVKKIPVGAVLVAKAFYYDQGRKEQILNIRARGIVTANIGNGNDLAVKWETDFKPYKLTSADLLGMGGLYWDTVAPVTNPIHLARLLGTMPPPASKMHAFPLNQILYGPPGTGKTYHTITRAVALLENTTDEAIAAQYPPNKRAELRQKFEDYCQAQRIEFVTFHQAFSYEDFVEGIKPLPPSKVSEGLDGEIVAVDTKPVQYDVVAGVFRRVCESAAAAANTAATPVLPVFDNLYNEFIAQLDGRMKSTRGALTFYSKTNLPVTLTHVNPELPTKRLTFLHANSAQQDHHIDKKWIKNLYDKYTSIDQIKHLTNDITKAVGGSNASLMWVVFNELKKHEAAWVALERSKQQTIPPPPFVLIIDEINRGNVANIFGELITLLEDDKRAGGSEALTVTLPYSKEKFSVPQNLYLLGTMNTADRSVEALDTALRRRFSFTEMLPQPELLSPHQMIARLWWQHEAEPWDGEQYKPAETALYELLGCQKLAAADQGSLWSQVIDQGSDADTTSKIFTGVAMTGVDVEKLLRAINARLEQLLDQDHCIGHALLIHVRDLNGLREAFRRNILPLLQEYFFGDWGKIGMVLGGAFIEQVNKKPAASSYKLLPFGSYTLSEFNEKPVYRLSDMQNIGVAEFQAIYA